MIVVICRVFVCLLCVVCCALCVVRCLSCVVVACRVLVGVCRVLFKRVCASAFVCVLLLVEPCCLLFVVR